MKKAYCLVLCILFLFIEVGCYTQKSNKILDRPQEKNEPFNWDFGQVKEGTILKHTFVFKNESNRILNIKDVHTSCGCTAFEVKKKSILPGESTFIEVQFNTKGYSGLTQQYIYVNTDNLDNPIIRYIIKADLVK